VGKLPTPGIKDLPVAAFHLGDLNETIAVPPTFMADVALGYWTLVSGLSVGVGW